MTVSEPSNRPHPATSPEQGSAGRERCGSCRAELESAVFCFFCQSAQPGGGGVDHFRLFGLPRSYALDERRLDALYERLGFALHPDFFAAAEPTEKARAERLAAQLNEGYRVLRSERERAAYLLRLLAGDRALDTRRLPEGFLQEMFGLQEEIDALDDGGEPAERERLRATVDGKLEQTRLERETLFAALEQGTDSEGLQAIQTNLNQENYLRRLEERLAV